MPEKSRKLHTLIGLWTGLESFLLIFVALFAVSSLMILITTAEAGQNSSITQIFFLSSALLIASQGSGIVFGSLIIEVIPLGITVMIVFIIRALASRQGTRAVNYLLGLIIWEVLNLIVVNQLRDYVSDNMPLTLVKTFLVFSVGFVLAAWTNGHRLWKVTRLVENHLSFEIRGTIKRGVTMVKATLIALGVLSLIVVLIWLVQGWTGIEKIFEITGMPTGSRILTSFISLAWVPNLMMWALAWVSGAEFQVGQLSHYSLIASHSVDLPSVPLFGLLPSSVPDPSARAVILWIPIIAGLLICFLVLWLGNIRAAAKKLSSQEIIHRAAFSLVAPIVSAIVLTVILPIFFQLTNGSLGTKNLTVVGVRTFAAVQSVARPLFAGYLIAWVISVAIWAIRAVIESHRPVIADSMLAGLDDNSTSPNNEEQHGKSHGE